MNPTLFTGAPGSILSTEDLSQEQILSILKLARQMHAARVRKATRQALGNKFSGKRVALLFYEASTRTRVSFEFAAKTLGATTTVISAVASSIEKGESLLDNGYTLRALGADVIVVRHPSSGAPNFLAQHLDIPIINAGDGMHEHPSQALLDAYTILEHKRSLCGLKVVLVGDILHSRVARSNIHLLAKFGAKIALCGPPELLPAIATTLAPGVRVERDFDRAVKGVDVVMMLRIQKERLAGINLSVPDYIRLYQLTPERLAQAKRDTLVMHPGPMVRGMELTGEIADGPQSVILEQVRNGVAIRMAILANALEQSRSEWPSA